MCRSQLPEFNKDQKLLFKYQKCKKKNLYYFSLDFSREF